MNFHKKKYLKTLHYSTTVFNTLVKDFNKNCSKRHFSFKIVFYDIIHNKNFSIFKFNFNKK
jgi:hypothetical protein